MVKKILLVILVLLILIQFIRPKPNGSSDPTPAALGAHYPLPDSVRAILSAACLDCHSNNSRYPWYDKIAPASWLVAYHISGGKQHLNFDTFNDYTVRKKVKRLRDISETVDDGSMPMSTYTSVHKDARLSDAQKKTLTNWAEDLAKTISDTTKAQL